MERRCPKCGGKLGIFDLKPNCPHCGCSIMYYDMDKRLEEDSIKAEAEWQKLDEILDKITPAFVKRKRAEREKKEKEDEINPRPQNSAGALNLRESRNKFCQNCGKSHGDVIKFDKNKDSRRGFYASQTDAA